MIKILKDTPFDIAGTILSIYNFKLKYGYIYTNNATHKELFDYIKACKVYPTLAQTQKYPISDWFEAIEMEEEEFPEKPLEITIKKVKSSWTREDVIDLCKKAYREGAAYSIGSHDNFKQIHLTEDEWLKENL